MVRGREYLPGHHRRGPMRPAKKGKVQMWVTKPATSGESSPQPLSNGLQGFSEAYPALFEYMTLTQWPDGGQRTTATVILFIEEGQVKACLSDRETDRSLWKTGETVEDVLLSLEEDLQRGAAASWRNSTKGRSMKRK